MVDNHLHAVGIKHILAGNPGTQCGHGGLGAFQKICHLGNVLRGNQRLVSLNIYYNLLILQLEDIKGNRYGTHGFVKSGKEEHCAGAYTASKGDPVLGGYIGMCRDIE